MYTFSLIITSMMYLEKNILIIQLILYFYLNQKEHLKESNYFDFAIYRYQI